MRHILWAVKTGLKARPIFLCLILLGYISLYALSPLTSLMSQKIVNILTTSSFLSQYIIALIVGYVVVVSYSNIQFSFSMLFIENIENSLSQRIQTQLFASVSKLNLVHLDKADYLNKIYRARNTTWYNLTNYINDAFHCIGELISIVLSFVLIAYSTSFKYIIIIIIICIIDNITCKKRTEETVQRDVSVSAEQRKRLYHSTLLNTKENVRETRTYGVIDWIHDKWLKSLNSQKDIEIKFVKRWAFISISIGTIALLLDKLLIILMVYDLSSGKIDIGNFVLIQSSKDYIIRAVSRSTDTIVDLLSNAAYVADLREVLTYDDTFHNDHPNVANALEVENVSFSYNIPSEYPTLNNISLNIKKGEIIALVGANGSGKSTFAKVAMGLIQAHQGIVSMDDYEVSAAYQDFSKFELLLRENVGFGKLNLIDDDNEVYSALSKADCFEILGKVKNNLNTAMGKNFDKEGIELSGGQWQRIAIARAFMGKHNLIVFDEPAASLDPMAELEQFEKIKNNMNNTGGLLISHRIGMARLADKIAFMLNGEIVEYGSHNELLRYDSNYKAFYESQAQWYKR